LRWFGIPACTANPEGHTSITGTARSMRMIFYITLTSLQDTPQIEPSLLSFLKERGRSSPDFVVRIDRSFLDLRRCVARRDRRRCPGSAGGRPRSGRRPWTPAPRGACLFGESDLVVLRILPGCWGVSAPSPVHPGLGQARSGCPSFLRRAGRHGVVRQGAVGWGHSSGATTPAGWGSDTKATGARPLFGWLVGGRPRWRSWGSDNKAARARPRFGWLMPRRG
jgi:hypothetical protein